MDTGLIDVDIVFIMSSTEFINVFFAAVGSHLITLGDRLSYRFSLIV